MMSVKISPSFAKFLPLLFLKSSKNGAERAILSVQGVKCNMFRDRAACNLMSHPIPHVAGIPNTCPKINNLLNTSGVKHKRSQSVTLQVSPSKESFSTPLRLSGPTEQLKAKPTDYCSFLSYFSLFSDRSGENFEGDFESSAACCVCILLQTIFL